MELICVMNHWIDNDVRQDVMTNPSDPLIVNSKTLKMLHDFGKNRRSIDQSVIHA